MFIRVTFLAFITAWLASCGGTTVPDNSPTEPDTSKNDPPEAVFSDLMSDDVLQKLSFDSNTVRIANILNQDIDGVTADKKLSYVAVLQENLDKNILDGDIVGSAASSLPQSDVNFATTGGAPSAVVVLTEDNYSLSDGDVSGVYNASAGTIKVDLTAFSGTKTNGTSTVTLTDASTIPTMNLTTAMRGAGDCGAVNILCAGSVIVAIDGTTKAELTADSTNAVVGFYGTDTAYEIGGTFNITDTANTNSAGASFIAAQE